MNDTIVIGAGAAGLAAAARLAADHRRVLVLEARDRIGGRAFTHFETGFAAPIELGAEFIHGAPQETLALLARAGGRAIGRGGTSWQRDRDGLRKDEEFFPSVDDLLRHLDSHAPDQSVAAFLQQFEQTPHGDAAMQVRMLVEGFDAADPADASLLAIAQEWSGDAGLHGSQSRPSCGYAPLMGVLAAELSREGAMLALQTIVESIAWERGAVRVHARRFGALEEYRAHRAVITVPVSLLQLRAIAFAPELPAEKMQSLRSIAMGPVVKVVLRFRTPFWRELRDGALSDASFFWDERAAFGAFWTRFPLAAPLLVAWAGGPRVRTLRGTDPGSAAGAAIEDLARIFDVPRSELEGELQAAYAHDWERDPYARGAYSYLKVGGMGSREALGEPVERTLYFAGEATALAGEAGTVAGALRSGYAAATAIMSETAPKTDR